MKTNIFALLMSFLTLMACAQSKPTMISGQVIDADNKSVLVGVSVYTKGSTKGTTTDVDGRYRLMANQGQTLVFSFIGYESKEAFIESDSVIHIRLKPDAKTFSEVVVSEAMAVPASSFDRSSKRIGSKAKTAIAPAPSTALPSIAPEKAKFEETHKDIFIKPVYEPSLKPQARILTAGEWNDLQQWSFWQNLIKENQWAEMQNRWKLFTNQKIQVLVEDKKGKAVNDLVVELWANNQVEWQAKTDIFGEAVLWQNLFQKTQNRSSDYAIKIKNNDGTVLKNVALQGQNAVVKIALDHQLTQPNVTDVMFVVDATGSMGDEIDYLKSELEDIVSRVQSSDNQEVIRLGMTFYRDHGDEYLVRNFDFKTNVKQVLSDLNQQGAGGGGDFEEAVEEALDNAIHQQRWSQSASTRLLFLILDAPPHYDEQRIKAMQKNIASAAAKGIKIIPVVASGIDKNTEFLMRMTAQATNGTYVFLTDDSGVGSSHLKPTVGNYQVEYLNNLILRLIKKYSLAVM
jgi:CarboxypepD_reg-like domain/von Willebrand factor type A domain